MSAPEPLGLTDCELVRDSFLAQPVAATTSLAFVAGSALVLATRRSPGSRVHAATMAAVGFGSWWYHGPQGHAAEALHDIPIALLLVGSVAVPVARWRRGRPVLADVPRRRRLAWSALGLAAAAGVAYGLGRTGSPLCRPESVLQMHGAWHVLAAATFAAWGLALWPRKAGT
jgi:hypothetical protein